MLPQKATTLSGLPKNPDIIQPVNAIEETKTEVFKENMLHDVDLLHSTAAPRELSSTSFTNADATRGQDAPEDRPTDALNDGEVYRLR